MPDNPALDGPTLPNAPSGVAPPPEGVWLSVAAALLTREPAPALAAAPKSSWTTGTMWPSDLVWGLWAWTKAR